MKNTRTFEFPIETTILIITHHAVSDVADFMLKLIELGIEFTDFGDLENEDIFEIKLKYNHSLTQDDWNQFIAMLQENSIAYLIKYSAKEYF